MGLAYRPVRLIPVAILLGLLASAIGGRYSRLAALAAGTGALCFAVGMTFAVLTSNPLY